MRAEDIQHLERLSDHNVLRRLPVDERHFKHNRRSDAVRYMREWAALLEAQLMAHPKSGRPGSLADWRHSDPNPTLAPALESPKREPVLI
jgi:hypothetical protein